MERTELLLQVLYDRGKCPQREGLDGERLLATEGEVRAKRFPEFSCGGGVGLSIEAERDVESSWRA